MFGKVVRFDGADDSDGRFRRASEPAIPPSEPALSLLKGDRKPPSSSTPAPIPFAPDGGFPAGPAPLFTPDELHDASWMSHTLDRLDQKFVVAQQSSAVYQAALIRLANTLCRKEWNSLMRSSRQPESWPPDAIADLVIKTVEMELRNAQYLQDPEIANKYHEVAADLQTARAENDHLRQRVAAAEDMVREMREQAAKEALRQQEAAVKRQRVAQDRAGILQRQVEQRQRQEPPTGDPPRPTLRVSGVVGKPPLGDPKPPPRRDGPSAAANVAPVGIEHQPAPAQSGPEPAANTGQSRQALQVNTPQSAPTQPASRSTATSGDERVDDVVRVIAETGLCRAKDVRVLLMKQWEMASNKPAVRHLDAAIKFGFIEQIAVRLEWGGQPSANILVLTQTGRALAEAMGVKIVRGQYEVGMAVHRNAEHLYVILEVADILAVESYSRIDPFPAFVPTSSGHCYPDLTAIDPTDQRLLIEVERGTYKDENERDTKWLRAAEAGGGVIHLVTPNNEVMMAVLDEVKQILARRDQRAVIRACNIREYRKGARGVNGAIWTFETD